MDPRPQVFLDERRHGIVLVRPLVRAAALSAVGIAGFLVGWPASIAGMVLLAVAGCGAVAAVWRWDRTHVVLTSDTLSVASGTLRRRAATVRLARVGPVEVEQSLLGRVLGYGTIVVGELEISCVPRPRELGGLVQRLAG